MSTLLKNMMKVKKTLLHSIKMVRLRYSLPKNMAYPSAPAECTV